MIVPRNRLLLWFAVVALPFSLIGAAIPTARLLVFGLMGVFLLIALLDAVLSRDVLKGLKATTPGVIRMARERETAIEITLQNPSQNQRPIRLALAWPDELSVAHEEMAVTLPEGHEWSRIAWPCRPLRRGRFLLKEACLEAPSRLGFWAWRHLVPLASEIRVYPDLHAERQTLGQLLLNRSMAGSHATRQMGKGREFEKLREYVAGDSYEDVHWKATARKGHPITKVFQIERTQEIYVVIDASRLSGRQNFLERSLTAALLLGLAAERQGDLFGILTFSDKVEKFIRARNGKAHYNTCRDAIYELAPRQVNPAFDEVCSFIRLNLRRRAMILFLTALDDPVLAESFVQNAGLIARQHLLFVGIMQPPGAVPIFSSPETPNVDVLYDQLAGHMRWHSLQEVGQQLRHKGIGSSVLAQEQLSAGLVAHYLNLKKRQLL